MLLAVQNLFSRLLLKTELVLRAGLISFETARQDRLYGALSVQTVPAQQGAKFQSEKLFGIVQSHCDAGMRIVDAQAAATINLDAAEYAFSSVLDELRGVMRSAPLSWTPERPAGTRSTTPVELRAAQAA